MSDGLFFTLAGLAAAGMIALALVAPQGLGRPSPGPFGHPVVSEALETPPSAVAPPPPRPLSVGTSRLKGTL